MYTNQILVHDNINKQERLYWAPVEVEQFDNEVSIILGLRDILR